MTFPTSIMLILAAAFSGAAGIVAGLPPADQAPAPRRANAVATVTSPADDARDNAFTYYAVRRDFRRCAFPYCGGWFVSRLNRSVTLCSDGTWSAECYVAEIDWDGHPAVDITAAGRYILRGIITAKTFDGNHSLGVLTVSEVWSSPTAPTADGATLYRVTSAPIACAKAVCQTHEAATINSEVRHSLTGVDVSALSADGGKSSAIAALSRGDRILAFGSLETVAGSSEARVLRARAVYLPVVVPTLRSPITKP